MAANVLHCRDEARFNRLKHGRLCPRQDFGLDRHAAAGINQGKVAPGMFKRTVKVHRSDRLHECGAVFPNLFRQLP